MRRKNLIISIVALVIVSAGIAALSLWPQDEIGNDAETISPPVDETSRIDLVRVDQDEVAAVHFTPQDGAEFSLIRDLHGEGFVLALHAEDPIFPGDTALMRSAFNMAISLTNITVVAENADDEQLEMFGLIEPVLTWRVELIDGTAETFMVGAAQVAGTGRFARSEDSREVTVLTERQSTLLLSTLEDMYDITFVPDFIFEGTESIIEAFDHILLERQDGVIEFHRLSREEQLLSPLGTSMFQMLQPTVGDASDHMVQLAFLDDALEIAPSRVEAVRPADLAPFGLDAPARLTFTAGDWERTLLVGNRNAEGTGRYVMIEGYDAVLLESFGEYLFLGIDPGILRARLIWLNHITEIDYITFTLEDETRILRFEHDVENDSLAGFLDEVEISETNARRLYMAVLRILQSGTTDEQIPSGAPDYTITIHLLDGGVDIMELYALSHAEFLIVRNGENTGFFITRLALHDTLISRFEIIDRGGELPAT